ncbi:MAG: cytochrome ubiquinol oxidase subunit I [Actinomycetota bacterium]|nr:cytochrome ubiquinol oxidase subunit I [Actinomycetota bacterium]
MVDSIRVECKVAQRHGYDTGLEPQEEMLENFVAARAVFGMSLSFHILFASLGVVPFMLLVS